jgi:hypothetical protein
MKIEQGSNWGYWDQLDGKEMVEGEMLKVTWPDGTVEVLRVRVERGTLIYEDHGHEGRGKDNKAFTTVNHHGVEARVYLRGLEAERV